MTWKLIGMTKKNYEIFKDTRIVVNFSAIHNGEKFYHSITFDKNEPITSLLEEWQKLEQEESK